MALLTLSEYKALMGIGVTDTRDDVQISALLETASVAVETYTGRDFDQTNGAATTRTYLYDGSGFLDVDDCSAVTAVSVVYPNAATFVLDGSEYSAMPDRGSVVYYLVIHSAIGAGGGSPEMGFQWNLDNYHRPGGTKQPSVSVTAVWGWPSVPVDVKLATSLTISELISAANSGRGEGLSAEAIEGWSRSYGSRSAAAPALAIPNRARDLLAAYQRVFV